MPQTLNQQQLTQRIETTASAMAELSLHGNPAGLMNNPNLTLFLSGESSDLTIEYNGWKFYVHKSVLFPLNRVPTVTNAGCRDWCRCSKDSGVIQFPEEEPITVWRMLEYLYTGTYSTTNPNTSSPSSPTFLNAPPPTQTPKCELRIHLDLIHISSKYPKLPSLNDIAFNSFLGIACKPLEEDKASDDEIVECLAMAYDKEIHYTTRSFLILWMLEHRNLSLFRGIEGMGPGAENRLLKDTLVARPELAFEVMNHMVQLMMMAKNESKGLRKRVEKLRRKQQMENA